MIDRDIPDADARRRALLLLLGGALLPRAADARPGAARLPSCVLTPEQTEGPYFLDARMERSDIRADRAGRIKPGTPLTLRLNIAAAEGSACTPLAGALVDIWHCDAAGEYSGVDGPDRSLRGYQVTDRAGGVRFTTIFPGWYPGRAVHIHFKVRAKGPSGRAQEIVSQLYFDDAVTQRVHGAVPYASRQGRAPRNRSDGLFQDGGDRLLVPLREEGNGGYAGTFDIALRLA